MSSLLSLIPLERDGAPRGFEQAIPEVMRDVMPAVADLYRSVGFEEPWVCYLATLDGVAIGTCGFKSPPCENRVEIAYFTFPEYEGRGMASAMAARMIEIARSASPEVIVAAQTLPERNASHRVLEKNGFRHVETLEHPEDGTVFEWQLSFPGA